MKTCYNELPAYKTKDGSIIREMMHPDIHGNFQQSLAEAIIPAGAQTVLHIHKRSEELYHITEGQGLMTLGGEQFAVQAGDTVHIPPGQEHKVRNTGQGELKILCCCSPAYAHEDTILKE